MESTPTDEVLPLTRAERRALATGGRTRGSRHTGRRRVTSVPPIPTPDAKITTGHDVPVEGLPLTRAERRRAIEAAAARAKAERGPLAVTRPLVGVLALVGVLSAAQASTGLAPAAVATAVTSAPSADATIRAAILDQASRAAVRESIVEATEEKAENRADEAKAQAEAIAAAEAAAAAAAREALRLAPPVEGPMSSGFGYRADPFGWGTSMHAGQDFVAACGLTTHAAADGTVVESGWMGGYGWRVVVEHAPRDGQTFRTTYNHMTQQGVGVGTVVHKGDVVGIVGTTGSSTGCHVHFEVQVGGTLVDPMPYF